MTIETYSNFIQHSLEERKRRLVALRLSLLIFYSAIFLILFFPRVDPALVVIETLLATAIALWFGPLALLDPTGKRKWYEPSFLFNAAMFYYSLKGITIVNSTKVIYLITLNQQEIISSYRVVSVFIILGLLAWNIAYTKVIKTVSNVKQKTSSTVKFHPLRAVALLSGIGLVAFFLFFRSVGAKFFFFLINPLSRSYLTDGTLGIAAPLANLWKQIAFLFPSATILWLSVTGKQDKRLPVLWWVHALIGLVIYVLIGGRIDGIGFLLGLIIVYDLWIKPVSPSALVITGSIAISYAYLVSGWRNIVGGNPISSLTQAQGELVRLLNWEGFWNFLNGTDLSDIRLFVLIYDRFPKVEPLLYGSTLLRVFYQFIPRSIWPGKPFDLSIEIAALFLGPDTLVGTPPGFFAEMYINFHVVGVILGGIALGALFGWIYRFLIHQGITSYKITFYGILVSVIPLMPSATFANAFLRVGILISGVIIALWITSRNT